MVKVIKILSSQLWWLGRRRINRRVRVRRREGRVRLWMRMMKE